MSPNFYSLLSRLSIPIGFVLLLTAMAYASHPPLTRAPYSQLKKDANNFQHAVSARAKLNKPMPAFSLSIAYGYDGGLTKASFKNEMGLFVLADTNCPCVQAIESRIKELSRKYSKEGLRVVYIFSIPEERAIHIARFMQGYKIPFPAAHDKDQRFLKMVDGQCSSEVYLMDKKGYLRYHGRVDDSTFDPKAVRSRDLENAINALIQGKKVVNPEVPVTGCAIPRK